MDFLEYTTYVSNKITPFMEQYLKEKEDLACTLKEAMIYGLTMGGKRLRPFLVFATARALGAKEEGLVYVASALECIHAYSLIHDDMPEMDNDLLRRGKPSVHAKFGPATALLAGDALQALAFEFLSHKDLQINDNVKVLMVQTLATKAGYEGMCGGQAIDLDSEHKQISIQRLEMLHRKKTGALIEASVLMGAYFANANENTINALKEFAKYIGLAYQVSDDILDIEGNSEKLGKKVGSDLDLDKSTYPKLMGLEESKVYEKELYHKAILALENIASADFSLLKDFAKFVIERDH